MQGFKMLKHWILKWTKAQKTLALGLILIAAMVLAAIFSDKGFMNVYDFTEELDYLKQRNTVLVDENKGLRKEIEGLKSDPYAIEMLARDKLNMVKPGELVYQIVRENPPPKKSH